MKRVVFLSLISVLFTNTVFASETKVTPIQVPVNKEVMVFGEYPLRPKAEITEAKANIETSESNKNEVQKTEQQVSSQAQETQIVIPMAEPNIIKTPESSVQQPQTKQNNEINSYDIDNKESVIKNTNINTENTVYKNEKEQLQEKQTPNPDPSTDEEKFITEDDIEENENIINLDVSNDQLFKPKTEVRRISPEKIELEKRPIFNIPSQNHGSADSNEKISEKQMKGEIPSTKEYKLNKLLGVKDIYSKNIDKKNTQEEIIKNLHKSDKVDLDLKGRPLEYADSGVSHSLVNIGTVLRF